MQPKQPPKFPNLHKVRRRLFQDEENVSVDNNQEPIPIHLDESRQTAQERWNFDFENEIPLEGDWEWERISSD